MDRSVVGVKVCLCVGERCWGIKNVIEIKGIIFAKAKKKKTSEFVTFKI